MRGQNRTLAALAALGLALAPASRAHAFTTRVHIVLANDVIASLEASGDGTIQLRWSEHAVQIPMRDADAIVAQPLAFRAGAIGPDNTVFPAMTDGTHGVEQDPYRQCEMLYAEAFTQAERAYALGCFLHGATDAIAHHFVNHFTGETFTLNPLTSSRASSYENVVGHIVTESVIQSAIHAQDPGAFSSSELEHTIPQDFVLRTYFDVDSPVWQRMARGPIEKWEAARAADPGGNLATWASSAGFAPWEQIAMAPQYVEELQRLREELRAYMVDRIAALAAHPSIDAMPGPDGRIGTPDDETACTASCPAEFGEYWILVHLLAPRFDTRGMPLPSAFDKISTDLGDNLYGFLPAFVQVIAGVSAELNAGLTDTGDHGLDIDRARVVAIFAPVDTWASRTFAIDWTTAGMAVSPEWYDDLSGFLAMFGVRVTIPDILALLFGPIVDEIRNALIDEVRDRAVAFIDELRREYDLGRGGWQTDVENGLAASAPPALGGHALDEALDSGLLAYAFNLTAASLANHEVLLVASDPIGTGPASFDSSYTPEWTQIGQCDYLREAVFPYGTGLQPLLSVQQGATIYLGVMPDDSPVECHDGSLSSFGAPGPESCAHVALDALLLDPRGSLTRAYPPAHASGAPGCRGLVVPGLPEPPPVPDAGPMPDVDGGTTMPGTDAGTTTPPGSDGGCACGVAGAPRGGSLAWLALLPGLALVLRRRRRTRRWLGLAALLVGCSDPVAGDDASTPIEDAGGIDAREDPTDAAPPPDGLVPRPDAYDATFDDFLASLDGSVWSGLQTRIEGGVEIERAYEIRFQGGGEPMWGEIRNPFGPARQRVLRFVRPAPSGCVDASLCDVATTVSIPTGWETPEPLRGRMETWTIELIEGSPRALAIRDASGREEVFTEGAWPAPTRGLTAEVRVFQGGSGHPISDSFCTSGGSIVRDVMWQFARGDSTEPTLAYDLVAGAELGAWVDVDNMFGIRDIDGFDVGTLGGSLRTDQFFYVVRYRGVIEHPGGSLQMRERDDDNEDALWVFLGDSVGGTSTADLFLEVHNFFALDATPDEPSVTLAAGDVPIEIIIPRCEMPFADQPLHVEIRAGGGSYELVGSFPTRPLIDDTLFPPVLP